MDETATIGRFSSAALHADDLRVTAIEGTERLSALYEFRVRFRHDAGLLSEDELSQVLLAPCALALGPDDDDVVKGIAREVTVLQAVEGRPTLYEVTVVPAVWLLTVSKMSRIYQKMSVKDMAKDVLERYGLGSSQHFDLRIDAPDPREFCVQYHESDWDYLQRWFEHEGYFYWFEHSADGGETLVVADSNRAARPIPGNAALPYRDLGGLNRAVDSVFDWRSTQRRVAARVVLKDYNDQKPLLAMVGHAEVNGKGGLGTFLEYGDNFDSPSLGNKLAKKRAEMLRAGQLTLSGVTDCPRFHVGHTFSLTGHFETEHDREYLITKIVHHLGPIAAAGGGEMAMGLRASFEAIPRSVQFRPERTTEWPSIHGLMHGHVDSDRSGKLSTLDAQGRYRVRLPFDTTGSKGEAASMWVRMAQPYSGPGYGTHHPLHKGTEVLLAFYDGDPDRPVIVGTVPNRVTPGPSAAENASQSMTRTASGIEITMDDSVSKG